jgi:hypothetical protein
MNKSSIFCKVLLSVLVWQAATCCCATVLYDNLANTTVGIDLIGEFPRTSTGIHFKTDSSSYDALTATLLMTASAPQGPAKLVLYSDINSAVGSPLGVFVPPDSYSTLSEPSPATFNLSGISLSPNTGYWLIFQSSVAGPSFEVLWRWALDSAGSGGGATAMGVLSSDYGKTWTYVHNPDQAQIIATVVPEPPSVVLGSITFTLLLMFAVRHRERGNCH